MVEIDRLSLHVRAAAAPERAERLARRLRDAAVGGIERNRYALSPPGSPAYLFVERLAVQCAVSSEWDDAAIGAEVARTLAAALERSIERTDAMAFRDRAELLAAFYCALAEGRAWQCWWLETFDGLRPLSASAALRTSVINEGACGIAALVRLTEASFDNVTRLLTPGDAARVLEWFAQRPATGEVALPVLWKASASLSARAADPIGLLGALVAVERTAAGAAGAPALRVLEALRALRMAAARGDLRDTGLAALAPHEALRTAVAKLSLAADWLDRLDESEATLIAEELVSIAEDTSSFARRPAREQTAPARERLSTLRGGALVLLKALDWLGWPVFWAQSRDCDALARALAWTVALRALEPRSALRGLSDPALQQAFGVERPLELLLAQRRDARAMLGGTGITRTADALLEEFSRRIPGLPGASPGYVRRNALALPATVEPRADGCVVRLGRAPLDILLVLGGAKTGRIALPGGVALELRAEGAQ